MMLVCSVNVVNMLIWPIPPLLFTMLSGLCWRGKGLATFAAFLVYEL